MRLAEPIRSNRRGRRFDERHPALPRNNKDIHQGPKRALADIILKNF